MSIKQQINEIDYLYSVYKLTRVNHRPQQA